MAYSGNQAFWGMKPLNNGPGNAAPRIRSYRLNSAYTTAIGEGCIISKTALGVVLTTSTEAGGRILGVAAHYVKGSPDAGSEILVYDDPDQEFAINLNASITDAQKIEFVTQWAKFKTNTANTTTLQGKTTMIITGIVSTQTNALLLQIKGWVDAIGEPTTTANHQAIVKLQHLRHTWTTHSATGAT